MIYADYAFYTDVYMGLSIEETDFQRLALRASAFLDYYTQGKAGKHAELAALKMACCALAEQYQFIEAAKLSANKSLHVSLTSDNSGELQSQTVGSWSKTYRSSGESANAAAGAAVSAKTALSAIAQEYLAGTGMLYRGRGCCCGHVSAYSDSL